MSVNMNNILQNFFKGLAGEFLLQEFGDVLPVELRVRNRCYNSLRPFLLFFRFQLNSSITVQRRRCRLRFTMADVANQVAWRRNNAETTELV